MGDFVQLQCNETVPADILLLHTSDQKGICHLETSNLDGETNLKQRQVVKGFFNQVCLEATFATCLPSVLLVVPRYVKRFKTEAQNCPAGGNL